MDNSKRYERLFEDLEHKKKRIGEEAAEFPTKEEYLEKDTEERLSAAKEILARYAHVSRYDHRGKSAAAEVKPKDKPDATLLVNVSHLSERREEARINEGPNSGGYRTRYVIPEAIDIRVWAHDPENGMTSDVLQLGELREGKYTDEEGEEQEGWHVFIPDGRFGPEGKNAMLGSQRGQEMVEFVDAAVIGLIDGVISDQRKFIGGQAVESSVQPVDSSPV